MAEPFSLTVNVIQIISACTSTIKTLDHLVQNYIDASAKLRSLAAKASLVKATLNELNKTLKGRSSFFAKRIDDDADLKSAIDQTLTGCWTVFLLLQKELKKWVPENGKEATFLKKAGLIFQDEIIQDYRIQIEGHVEGLKTVLVCLQAQTVAETHETLQKANATLERIANATIEIREQHKDVAFPESVYEGYTTYDEDKPFDKELLDSAAYRAAFQSARKNSLVNGDASVVTVSTRAPKDFLSDQPFDEEGQTLRGSNDLLNSDAMVDLISFDDDPNYGLEQSATSPNAQLMEGLMWEAPPLVPHILDGDDMEMKAHNPPQPRSQNSMPLPATDMPRPSAEVQIDDFIDDMLQDAARHGVPVKDIQREPRRDSGQPLSNHSSVASTMRRVRGPVPTIIRHEDEPSTPSTIEKPLPTLRDDDGLIPCATEHEVESALSRSGSMSTASARRLSSPTLGYFNLYPTSPTSQTPGIMQLPLDHRLSNPQDDIPQADEHLQDTLLASMHHVTRSLDPVQQLNWAEDVFDHLSVTMAHEHRIANLNVRRKSIPTPFSESERTLQLEASRIVENLRKAGYGRAYFLSAKYVVPEGEKEHLHLLAAGQRYHRSEFYLGKLAEDREIMGDAVKRYKVGESYGDAACLHRLSQAYLHGQLGIKKNKDEGIRLLRAAAKVADRDCPDPLHHLATMQLAPPPKVVGITKRPLVQRDIQEAILHLRRAALLGHGPSQLRLGQAHRTGFFDPKDAKKAEQSSSSPSSSTSRLSRTSSKWGRRVSGTPSSTAPSNSDVVADPTVAMHYLHLSARRGVPEADYEIAHELLWKSGELSEQHQKLAYAHTARALLGDVPLANGLMGKILEEGIGCKKNLVEAEQFYFRGRKEGDDWARSRSDYLLNQGVGVSGGVEAGTYKKPTAAERKVAARNNQSVY